MKLKMGTRGSALALAQAGWAARELQKAYPGLEIETVVIRTSGDLFAVQPPRNIYLLEGTKGLFVKEIEEALRAGEIDFAVHSAKDLPGALAPGLCLAAYPRREDPRDVFIGRDGLVWSSVKAGARIGTSSLRRKVQILKAKPQVEILPIRGNVDTRLRKLQEGAYDGLVLAAAGLRRLGRADVPHEAVSTDIILPAPGQGALAVEVRADRPDLLELLAGLDHAGTRLEVEFERSFLAALGGGCSTPLGALARARCSKVELTVFWSEQNGSRAVRLTEICDDCAQRDDFTGRLAARIKSRA